MDLEVVSRLTEGVFGAIPLVASEPAVVEVLPSNASRRHQSAEVQGSRCAGKRASNEILPE